MSSYNCCISQDPPSPEGFPSRPVKLSTDAMPVASWSTASHLSKSEDVAELRTLFEGDNSDADEDECRVMKVKRSSSTLDAVKSQLRKHLSCESALSKHRTRSTVGNSEEEIQRRKELRLIRDRRIKEELSSKGAYDDTKSLSTLATENSPHMEPWPRIRNEDMYSSNPLEVAPTLLLLARKSADEFYVRKPSPISAIQRRHSLAVLDKPERLIRTTTDCDTYRSSSDFSIPPAPILKLQRLPSIVDPATRRTSWRLSFTSNQRAIQLRALSQDHELSAASATRGTLASPLRWFRGQGIGAPPFSTVKIPDLLSAPDNPPSQAVFYPELVHYEGVDGDAEQLTAPISLLDMRISQRLASRGLHSHSSSPQLSSWGSHSHYRARSRNSEASNQKETSQSRHHDSESNSVMSDSKISTNWGDVLRDGISSIYSSTGNCAKHVSESSRFSVPSLLAHNKRQVSLQSDELQVNSAAPQAPPIIVTTATATDVNRSADSHGIPSSRHDHRYAIKSPILVSETLSFREREAELDKIKIRFPKSMEKLGQTSSVRSKFNEDFGGKQTPPPTVAQKNPSLSMVLQLPRLAKLVSRSYDGANPFEFQVPGRQGFGYTFSNSSRSTGGTVSLSSRSPATEMPGSPARDPLQPHGDDAEGIWAQALKWTQEEFQSQLATESSPMKKDLSDHHGSFLAIGNVSRRLKGKGKASMDSLKDVNVVRLLNEGMDIQLKRELRQQARKVETERAKAHEWADELEARERQAKAKTAAVGKGPFLPCAKMPPESWARFPSHNREERTASAGLPDHVSSKDFAIKDMRDGVIEWMTSDRKHHHHHHHHHKIEQHHSLPMRLSRQIRTSLYRLRTTKSMATGDAIHGRKGSVSVGGKLEFPELEIIAGEIAGEGLYEEVERETAEVMRRDERAARMVVFGEGGIDGEVDNEGNMTVLELGETSEISIADPRFYDDCITLPLEEDAEVDNHS